MESHLRVEIVPRTHGEDGKAPIEAGYLARINGAEFPIVDAAFQTEGGQPFLSLVLAPDSLSFGEAPASAPPLPQPQPAAVSRWGDGSVPDPRASIPGWQPEKLGNQVAGHAERVVLSSLPPMSWLRRFGGEGGSVAVTA